jgi:hypothetical protein
VRSTAAPYTESRLTRSVANERVGFPVVEQQCTVYILPLTVDSSQNPLIHSLSPAPVSFFI